MVTYYYPQTIKGVVVALMDLFNDIRVYKYNSSGLSAEEILVPFSFGPMTKTGMDRTENHYFDTTATDLSGYTQSESVNSPYYLSTPRIALTLTSIVYNPERCYGPNEWRYWLQDTLKLSSTDIDSVFSDYQPTPYDMNFSLAIMTNSMDYFSQIMENILPYFNPKLYLRVKEFSFLNVDRDLPVVLGGIPLDFSDDQTETDQRQINASLDLTVEAFLYRPWTTSKIIKVINSKYYINNVIVTTSATSGLTGGSVLTDSFSTSGYMLSGGSYLPGANPPTTYSFSGTYQDNAKTFNWFKDMVSSGSS